MPLPPTGGSFTFILNMHSVADAVLLIEKMCSQGIILINLIGFLFFCFHVCFGRFYISTLITGKWSASSFCI